MKYEQVKKDLMDDLLTGKIIIKDDKRFKETRFNDVKDVGKIPWDWEVKTLADIANICYGKDKKNVDIQKLIVVIFLNGFIIL